MKVAFKIPRHLLEEIHADLDRPHEFAAERVGFVSCRAENALNGGFELYAQEFHPVADEHYIDDPRVGAMMGSAAIRTALQFAYHQPVSMFHIHRHEHRGKPGFSSIDRRENARFIPDFWKVRPGVPHGAIVLSLNSMAGMCWIPTANTPVPIGQFAVIDAQNSTLKGIV